jgi:LPS export ABC transporter protein LptC
MHKVNNIRRFLVILASLSALCVAGTIAYRMHRDAAPTRKVPKLPLKVDVSLQRVHFTETKKGVKSWDLSAERAEYNKESDSTTLTGVRLVLTGKASTGDIEVTAERAEYRNSTRDVLLSGKVVGRSGSGMEFSTAKIAYVAARSQLETDQPVRFSDGGLQLEGTGMEFQTQTRRLKLMKDVRAVYRPQGAR